jgi:uncharacterized protein (TIGR03086 family)
MMAPMEPDTTTLATPSRTGGLAPDDPRAVFAAAVATGGRVVAAVRPDQLDLPTPCDDFTVRGLLGHLVSVLDRVALLGRGGNPFEPGTQHELPVVADDGWSQAWTEAAHALQEVWSDDAVLARPMTLPWLAAPGAVVLGSYTCELTVHTWDLATVTGATPDWDDRVLEVSLASITAALPATGRAEAFRQVTATMPEDQRRPEPPFADAVPVPGDAPAIDRLVAWTGRRP